MPAGGHWRGALSKRLGNRRASEAPLNPPGHANAILLFSTQSVRIQELQVRLLHIITGLDSDGAEKMLQRLIESHNGNPHFRHTVCSLTTQGRLGAQMRA